MGAPFDVGVEVVRRDQPTTYPVLRPGLLRGVCRSDAWGDGVPQNDETRDGGRGSLVEVDLKGKHDSGICNLVRGCAQVPKTPHAPSIFW